MNADDYAIVVGIERYPGFGRTDVDPNDLNGPDNDATAIYEWLTAPDKGGVPPGNAWRVRSRDFPSPASVLDAEPQRQAITHLFDRLEVKAQANGRQGHGLRVGRRLYLYMSGHGFAPRRKEGAVFVANATRVMTYHVFASKWLEWFCNAEYFDELVLWMDSCMVFDLTVMPEAVGYRAVQGTGPGRIFSAFAARFPQQAVERKMPDGLYHGVFTYTLLQGLNGAAADANTHQVTSASLRNYLYNSMKAFMTEDDLHDPNISKEPDFGFDDPIVFCTIPAVDVCIVDLRRFPLAAEGKRFIVVTGAPPTKVAGNVVHNGVGQVPLPPGVYFLKMDDPPLQQGFEVTGGPNANVDLT